MPTLSVLIPTYNRETYVADAIRSALDQPYTDLEVIVSDNASTDRTVEIARGIAAQDSRVRIFVNDRNLGPIGNWKNALAQARGEYAHWLWSDDYVEPGFYSVWNRLRPTGPACFQVAAWLRGENKSEVVHQCDEQYFSFKTIIEAAPTKLLVPASPAAYILPTASLRRHFYDSMLQTRRLRCVDTAIGPDLLMVLGSVMDCGGLHMHPEPLINFRQHGGSISMQRTRALKPHYTFALAWFIHTHRIGLPIRAALHLVRKGLKFRSAPMVKAGAAALLVTRRPEVRAGE